VIPARVLTKLRSICLAMPGAYEEAAWVGTRWMVQKRNFAHVVEILDGHPPAYARAAGSDGVVLTFRVDEDMSDTLRTAGPPFFHCVWGTKWGTKVIGMHLGPKVDWDEVRLLVEESHRLLAPKPKVARAKRG
jgi:hypothetical protein